MDETPAELDARLAAARPSVSAGEPLALARLRARVFGVDTEPLRFGRHEIVRRLGEGGNGVVWEAWDPDLRRNVAIKVPHEPTSGDARRRARLLREARSLAALCHPHVLSVFDVTTLDDGRVVLVLELVRGSDLEAWLARERPTFAAILDVVLAAGEGLAAAHTLGILHRDFKPANVLVGDDARARVADFGLSVAVGSSSPGETMPGGRTRSGALTDTGSVLGTRGYMAPEQARGRAVDTRADQYSFCVTVIEALVRTRCHGRAALEGALGRLPRAMADVLRRGIDDDPRRRFPSMRALLDALRRAARPRRGVARPAGALGLVALAVMLTGPATAARTDSAPPAVAQDGAPTSAAVQGLIEDAERHAIEGRREHADASLDRAARWIEEHGGSPHAGVDLARGRIALRFGDTALAERALATAYWAATDGGDARIAAEAAVLSIMATADREQDALRASGHARAAIARLDGPHDLVAAHDYALAIARQRAGRPVLGVASALAASMRFEREVDDPGRGASALALAAEIGESAGWWSAAAGWADDAIALLETIDEHAPELARAHELRARIASHTGALELAEESYERALAIRRAAHDPGAVATLYDLGVIAARVGDGELAAARYEAALQLADTDGAIDPRLHAAVLAGVGDLERTGARPAEAIAWLDAALEALAQRPAEDPLVIRTRLQWAAAAESLGATGDARLQARRAAEGLASLPSPDPDDLAALPDDLRAIARAR